MPFCWLSRSISYCSTFCAQWQIVKHFTMMKFINLADKLIVLLRRTLSLKLYYSCNLNFHLSFAILSQVVDIEANTIAGVGPALSGVNPPKNFLKW